MMQETAADRSEATPELDFSFAADADQLLQWSEDGRNILGSLLAAAHAPEHARTMRSFTQKELIETFLGNEHIKPLRKWVRSNVIPRLKKAGEEGRVRLTLEDFHAYMADAGLMPSRPAGSRAMRLMIGAYKGGSGKSSVTLHLSQLLGLKGWRVLVIDSDPQGTLTKAFGLMPELVKDEDTLKTTFDTIGTKNPVQPITFRKTHLPTVFLTPANLSLMQADMTLVSAFRREDGKDFYRAVDRALELVDDQFDFILVDTPPAFSMTSIAVLWAAQGLLLPMPSEIPDFAAAFDFCEMVGGLFESLEDITGEKKSWDPVIIAHSKVKGTNAADRVRQLAAAIFKGNRIEELIPDIAAVSNAFGEFKSVFEATGATVDSKSLMRAREAYSQMGDRLVRIVVRVWERQAQEARNG